MKRLLSLILSLLITGTFSVPAYAAQNRALEKPAAAVAANSGTYNYGEAMQKAIMFYEFQRSGKASADQRNNWRGDSGMNDGADVGLDLTGGYYDAGDHVKFNLPMAYTSAMLAWDVYENKSSLKTSGQLPYLESAIKWATDYLMKCHPSANVFYYQVGSGSLDHSWWGPAEVMQMKRPSYKVDMDHPGSAVTGEAAAALASASIIFADSDSAYSASCLKHAKELFAFADATKSDSGYTAASGYYDSWSGFYDELSWAATWLYLATNDSTYLSKAESYVKHWNRQGQSDLIEYKYTQSWDDVHYGAELLLARLTGKPVYTESLERTLDWWTTGYDGEKVTYTPKGLAWLQQWGSLRYSMTTAFLASVYAKWSGCSAAKAAVYKAFAKSQVDYALGSSGHSYEIGFGKDYPEHPHHRTAESSWADSMTVPGYSRHTLVGALVGGPDSSDGYTDEESNYTQNEPACDYNAGFVDALTELYDDYGGTPIAGLTANETPTNTEFFVNASVNASGSNFEEIKAVLCNESGWPAKVDQNLSYRYFIDISELVKAGYSASDVKINTNYNAGATVTGLIPWDAANNIYYVNIDFTGTKIYPGGQSAYQKECQFRISYPQDVNIWDNSNDFSYDGINPTAGGTPSLAKNIPVYDNGVKVYGNEPSSNNSSITPTVTTFDQASGKQSDVAVSVKWNGNTLTGISNGTYSLVKGTDYTVSGNTVTISKKYLKGQALGTVYLLFNFSSGNDSVLSITITDSSIMDSAITPTSASFDKKAENQSDIGVIMVLNGNTFSGIRNGSNDLVDGTDYTVDGNQVTILKSYLSEQPVGTTVLSFGFSAGSQQALTITISDSSVVPITGNLEVQMYNDSTQASVNGITPHFRLVNTGSTPIDLSQVKLHYYYTEDGTQQQTFWCDWSSVGISNVTASFAKLSQPKTGADTCLEIGFTSDAGTLAPNASVEVHARFSKNDWTFYDQGNDYSFAPKASSYADWTKVTGYLGDTLAWGLEP